MTGNETMEWKNHKYAGTNRTNPAHEKNIRKRIGVGQNALGKMVI